MECISEVYKINRIGYSSSSNNIRLLFQMCPFPQNPPISFLESEFGYKLNIGWKRYLLFLDEALDNLEFPISLLLEKKITLIPCKNFERIMRVQRITRTTGG